MDRVTCENCPYFVHSDDDEVNDAARKSLAEAGILLPEGVIVGVCHGVPPGGHFLPIPVAPQKQQQRIATPQPQQPAQGFSMAPTQLRPQVFSNDAACAFHPESERYYKRRLTAVEVLGESTPEPGSKLN